jgi:hypothetical protein
VITSKASEPAGLRPLLHSGKTSKRVQGSSMVVERTVPKTNNLSAAIKNWLPHFQHFAFFC